MTPLPINRHQPVHLFALLALALLFMPWASAQPTASLDPELAQEVRALLAGLDDHPALTASQRAVDAARADLDGLRFPVLLSGSATAQRADVSASDGVPQDTIDDASAWDTSATVTAVLRPFLLGDLGDAERQRRIALVQAERRHQETRANLEAAAMQAATGLLVAEHGVRIAEAGLLLAERAADATTLRIERGAARDVDGERAALEVDRAEESLRSATARASLAAARLADLVGPDARLGTLPDPNALPTLPSVEIPAPGVVQAELDLTLAEVGLASASRALLPTAQAAYAWNLDESAVTVSLESRTLQPTVRYETDGPFATQDTGPIDVEGVFTFGLSFEVGGDAPAARNAAAARRDAALAGLTQAQRDAALAASDRDEARRAARAELDFAEHERTLAYRDADEAAAQRDAGLATELDVLRVELTALQSDLTVLNARATLLDAILADYRDLAIPLSEVLP